MARSVGSRPEKTAAKLADVSPIRVILADSQAIYRVGMRKILAIEDDLRVVAQTETFGATLSAVVKFPADVMLFDVQLSPTPAEAVSELLNRAPALKVVAIVAEVDEQETVEYLRRGVRGLLTRAIAPDLLVRCLRKVAEGETWLDKKGVNWIIEAYRTQAAQLTSVAPKGRLSEKELMIISGVTQGMRNKDIALEVGTTEQVIKNYLRKIYDKLGVSDRLELALYCAHHRLLEARGRREPESSPEPSLVTLPADLPASAPAANPAPRPGAKRPASVPPERPLG